MREPSKAFICYRRLDSFVPSGFHLNVKAALHKLGFDEVFLDVDPQSGTHAQEDFESKAFHAIDTCDLFVALVGANWVTLLNARRDKRDSAAREIRTALYYEKEILPILVDGAAMPDADLPRAIHDFYFKHALEKPLASHDSITTIEQALAAPTKKILSSQKFYSRWEWYYAAAAIFMWLLCGVVPHVVGVLEYGWQPWWHMAGIWGGFFIWPMFLFPFALFGIYRPFTTLVRFIVRSSGFWQRCSYATPLIASTLLASVAWMTEVHDPREVPWTIDVALAQPGCQVGAALPSAIASLSAETRQNWLDGGPPITGLSSADNQRWRALINLSSYDSAGHLQEKYSDDPQFWLDSKCWPNAFFYLTAPIYNSNGTLRLNDQNYQASRKPIQESFANVLLNRNRSVYGVENSWTAWAYRISFFIIVWAGISGISMAIYFTMVSLRDPTDASIKRTPREDALLCLTYSMATVMTWIPFRMVTEYVKYLYSCPDISDDFAKCGFDITLYMPDLLLAALLLVGYLFVTVAMMRDYRRLALAFYGALMTAAALFGAFAVYRFHEQVVQLAGYWQFYVVIAVPSILLLLSLWYLFDPSAVRFKDFQKDISYDG